MKVSVIQHNTIWHDIEANKQALEPLIAQAADADLIMLPEMFSTGFNMQPSRLAEPVDGPTTQWLRQQAAKAQAAICGSIIVEHNGLYYNQMLFAHPDGRLDRYNKRHLFRMAGEHKRYAPGQQRVVVDYKGWRIMLLVCYDLRFPVWSRCLNADYDLIALCASWPAARTFAWETLLPARAIENQCYVAACNRAGADGNGYEHLGRSAIYSPKGERLAMAADGQTSIATATLNLDELRQFRKSFPAWADADAFGQIAPISPSEM